MATDHRSQVVLVISDDAELGALVAMNLRLRGLDVEQTSLALAVIPRWAPAFGRLDLLIVDVEAPERLPPPRLRQLVEQPWAQGVPLLLAAEHPHVLSRALATPPDVVIAQPTDVGGIVAAARTHLLRSVPA